MTGLFLSVLLPSALAIGQPFSQVLASLTRTVILPRAADPLFWDHSPPFSRLLDSRWSVLLACGLFSWRALSLLTRLRSILAFLFSFLLLSFSFSFRACPVVSHQPKRLIRLTSPVFRSRLLSFSPQKLPTTPCLHNTLPPVSTLSNKERGVRLVLSFSLNNI